MRAGFFIFLFLLSNIFSFSKELKDTVTISDSLYKISFKEFRKRYATDDTSKAIIKLFENKIGIRGFSTILFALNLQVEVNALKSSTEDTREYLIITSSALAFTSVFALLNWEKYNLYNRKNLYKILMNYNKGEGMPPKIRERIIKKFPKLIK